MPIANQENGIPNGENVPKLNPVVDILITLQIIELETVVLCVWANTWKQLFGKFMFDVAKAQEC